jgi:hypothetical protein
MKKILVLLSQFTNHVAFLIFVVLVCLFIQGKQSNKYFAWSKQWNETVDIHYPIHTDGAGYYAYLPQWFIYNNKPHFSFLEQITQKHKTSNFISGVHFDLDSHHGTNKYFIGTAIFISPFFLINHALQRIFDGKWGDGYSKSYLFTVSISALFYWLLGILGMISVLKLFSIPNIVTAFVILILSLGTSLNFYTVYYSSFSHVYSFCAISWFLFYLVKWSQTKKAKLLPLLGLLLGLIFILRPTNILIVLMTPFFFNSWRDFITEIRNCISTKKLPLILSLFLFFTCIFVQIYSNFQQTGIWSLSSYAGEHFDNLTDPKWFEVLFSFEKGLFAYAPVLFLFVVGIPFILRKSIYFGIGWIFVFVTFLYVTSSWWCWTYGGGLGMRPFIDVSTFLAIPIAFLLVGISHWLKLVLVFTSFSFIIFYQILQIQFNLNIIHYDSMNRKKYWDIFLKTDKRFSWMLHFPEVHILPTLVKSSEKWNFDPYLTNWTKTDISGKSLLLDETMPDPQFIFVPDSNWKSSKMGFRFQGEMYLSHPESNPSFIVHSFRGGTKERLAEVYVGNTISQLHLFSKFSKDYQISTNYSQVDSVEITMTKGAPITGVRSLSCLFYSLE